MVMVALPRPETTLFSVGALSGATPVPFRIIVCGLLAALVVITTLPVRAPDAVGVNVTFRLQEMPMLTLPPQLLVIAKSPLGVMLVIFRVPPPLLVNVTVCVMLVPMFCASKSIDVVLSETTGTVTTG